MSLVKAIESLNRIAGQYNLLEILNSKQCRRPDPATCFLTPQKMDKLQEYLFYIYKMLSKTYDPILEKLYMLLNAKLFNKKKTLKAGRKRKLTKYRLIKGGAGGMRAFMQVINIIVLIFIYAYTFNQGKIPEDKLVNIKEISDVVQECSIQNQVSLYLKPNKESPPLPLVVTAKVDYINPNLERIQKLIPRTDRTSVTQTIKASINVQHDLDRNKTIFRCNLLSLDKVMTSDEDGYPIEMERYKTETTLPVIVDEISVMLHNIVVSGGTNFYDLDRNAEIETSMQIFYNKPLQEKMDNTWHLDSVDEQYITLIEFPNKELRVGPELSGLFWEGNHHWSRGDKSSGRAGHTAFKNFSRLLFNLSKEMVNSKEDRTVESTRLPIKGLVTAKNMPHNSPIQNDDFYSVHNTVDFEPQFKAKISLKSSNRVMGNEPLKDMYFHIHEAPHLRKYGLAQNEESGRDFLRLWWGVYPENHFLSDSMYEFWQEKIPNMLQSYAVDDFEDSNVEVYLNGIKLPNDIAEKLNEVYTAANLQKLAEVAPGECNKIVASPESFANDWGRLQEFSIGGKKKKNRTRKK